MTDAKKKAALITPYGGPLVDLVAGEEQRKALIDKSKHLPSIQISYRSQCDLEMLAIGGFSPLNRFMGEQDYKRVLQDMRLSDGTLFPIPVTLPVDDGQSVEIGKEYTIRSRENMILAIMRVDERYAWDLEEEAGAVLGTGDSRHSLVSEMHTWGSHYISGPLTVIDLPKHYDFSELRRTPKQTRTMLEHLGFENVVCFQPRNPMHRAHETLTKKAMEELQSALLIQAVTGVTRQGHLDDYARVRCYEALVKHYYEPSRAFLNLLPMATRVAGPRAALWHAIINRNYGVNHLIVGRDNVIHEKNAKGKYFYDVYSVQKIFKEHEQELGVRLVPFKNMVYVPKEDSYEEIDRALYEGKEYISLSGTKIIEDSWSTERNIPEWFTRPEVSRIILEFNPPKTKRGFCVWLTGLPSAGKSTIADILAPMLMSRGKRVTVLDGDRVRMHLTKGLAFTKEDRISNILRVGYVASEVVKHNGVVLCALISPYISARDKVRAMIGEDRFLEVFVDTPVDVCEARDVKGMYAMAKAGTIKNFTGVDDEYESPLSPELRINTAAMSPEASALLVLQKLREKGFVKE
jgi:sulfate adenylyltransferase